MIDPLHDVGADDTLTHMYVGGTSKTMGNLTLLVFYGVGNNVAARELKNSIVMAKTFLTGKKFDCGIKCSTTAIKCILQNGCSGHGNCSNQTGKCFCAPGWGTSDCSHEIKEFLNINRVEIGRRQTVYYLIPMPYDQRVSSSTFIRS